MRMEFRGAAGDVDGGDRMGAEDIQTSLHQLPGHEFPPFRTRGDMTVAALQVAAVAEVDLEDLDPRSEDGTSRPFRERGMLTLSVHGYISFFLMIFRIWVEWARTTPAVMAAPTWTASIISSGATPRDRHWLV